MSEGLRGGPGVSMYERPVPGQVSCMNRMPPSIFALGGALLFVVLSACVNDEPCVPGLAIGATYQITVLRKQERAFTEDILWYQDCGDMLDLTAGSQFTMTVRRGEPNIVHNCRWDKGTASSLGSVQILETFGYHGSDPPLMQALVGFGHRVLVHETCRGKWLAVIYVTDRGDPFRVPPPGEESPVQMYREFLAMDANACRWPTSPLTPERHGCMNWFDVKIEKIGK
jgi:hypothetical protein